MIPNFYQILICTARLKDVGKTDHLDRLTHPELDYFGPGQRWLEGFGGGLSSAAGKGEC